MKISFVVLTYNRSDALLAVLSSLARQCGAAHEVLIADDGSRPEQIRLLRERCPKFQCRVRHIWHPDVGFTAARARNLAAGQAGGDYLVFLDGDCVPRWDFVAQHTRLAEAGYFVNGSRVLLSESLTQKVLKGGLDLLVMPTLFWWKARIKGDSNKLLHLFTWPWRGFRVKQKFEWRRIRSCNFAVWKSDFAAVNGFDETFKGWGHEDADLVLRLHHLGLHRKNGFMATEVFHLWHLENKRDQALVNKNRVVQRMQTHLVVSPKGLREIEPASDVQITALN